MTFQPRFQTLVDVFEHATTAYAPNPLFGVKHRGRWAWTTYREFARDVERARGGLADLGVGPGDRVAIIADNRPEWAIGAYATYTLGAAWVPMYESQLEKDWRFILRDCGAGVVLVADGDIARAITALRDDVDTIRHVVVLDGAAAGPGLGSFAELLTRGEASPRPLCRPAPDDICGFLYTSGTTGDPKGVRLSHGNLASNVSAIHEIFPMRPSDRSLSFLPWAHSFGQTVELHGLFSMGASMGIAEGRHAILRNLPEVRPTLLISVPTIFNRIHDGLRKRIAGSGRLQRALFDRAMSNEEDRRRLAADKRTSGWADLQHRLYDRLVFSKVRERFGGRIRFAFSGGAAISPQVMAFVDKLGITVYEGYGLTETSPVVTANWPGARRLGSVGKPIPGVRVEIDTDVTGDPKHGEIVVYGPNVMQGYHGLPDEDAAVLTGDGGFRTGDMGYLDGDGFLFVTGRIKEQYKLVNGKYVVPAPLEEQLKLSPFVENVFVDGTNEAFNVAVVVPDLEEIASWARSRGIPGEGRALLAAEDVVRKVADELAACSEGFKSYEKVRDFVFADEPFSQENDMLTPSLKLKRRVVRDRYEDRIAALYARHRSAA